VFALQIIFTALQIVLTPAEMILWSTSRHHVWAAVAFIEGVLKVGLSIWWAHRWGLAGVIGASVVVRLATNAWYLPLAASLTVGVLIRHALRRIAPGAALAATTIVAMMLIWRIATPVSLAVAIGCAAILVIAFTAAFGWLVFTTEERRVAIHWIMPALPPQDAARG
jgi:hypothetical protein